MDAHTGLKELTLPACPEWKIPEKGQIGVVQLNGFQTIINETMKLQGYGANSKLVSNLSVCDKGTDVITIKELMLGLGKSEAVQH